MSKDKDDGYGYTREKEAGLTGAPELNYRPARPGSYRPALGLIGCGGITEQHLKAYRKYGYRVSAFCDIDVSRARDRRDEFYPAAAVTLDHREILADPDIEPSFQDPTP